MLELTVRQARVLFLAAQGLLTPPARLARKADILTTIRSMGALQIDTINVVARSPYFVLWSRLGEYDPAWLDQLLSEGKLFEYWGHEASFLPIEDYGLFRRQMIDDRWRLGRWKRWVDDATVDAVRARIASDGPTRSADFERRDGRKGTWWDWKPEKTALDLLHTSGDLMIASRQNFQRIYDLRERVYPTWSDADLLDSATTWRELTLKSVRSLGVTSRAWVADYFRLPVAAANDAIKALEKDGAITEVAVEGWPDSGFISTDNLALAERASRNRLKPAVTTLLSPFDPVTWHRPRAKAMFGFDYQIECYTPAPKRRYGYFSLPILHHDELAGRLDAKAHRKEGIFEVRSLHLEPGADPESIAKDLADAIRRCAAWHRTPVTVVRQSDPPGFAMLLQSLLDA